MSLAWVYFEDKNSMKQSKSIASHEFEGTVGAAAFGGVHLIDIAKCAAMTVLRTTICTINHLRDGKPRKLHGCTTHCIRELGECGHFAIHIGIQMAVVARSMHPNQTVGRHGERRITLRHFRATQGLCARRSQ